MKSFDNFVSDVLSYKYTPLNKIFNENCLKTMNRIPESYVDLIITSPPYDSMRSYKKNTFERSYKKNTFEEFKEIAESLFLITKKGGVLVWIVGDQSVKGNETGTSFKQVLFFKSVEALICLIL